MVSGGGIVFPYVRFWQYWKDSCSQHGTNDPFHVCEGTLWTPALSMRIMDAHMFGLEVMADI